MNKKFMGIVPDINALENDAKDVSEARIKLDDLLNEIVDRNDDGLDTCFYLKFIKNIHFKISLKCFFSQEKPAV